MVDSTPPTIEAPEEIIIKVGKNVNLLKNVKVTDNYSSNIEATVNGHYDLNVIDIYNLEYVAKDAAGNITSKPFKLVVQETALMTMSDGVTYFDGILVVNKTYSLPPSYNYGLSKDLTSALSHPKTDAAKIGYNIKISSDYRSWYAQDYIYKDFVARFGLTSANTFSAKSGHSEHQSGLAVDLAPVKQYYGYTDEDKWIASNCYKYGFIIRYPNGKESITGYMYEPWHLRYVGIELAEELYNGGSWITLEEYFGITSKYN